MAIEGDFWRAEFYLKEFIILICGISLGFGEVFYRLQM